MEQEGRATDNEAVQVSDFRVLTLLTEYGKDLAIRTSTGRGSRSPLHDTLETLRGFS